MNFMSDEGLGASRLYKDPTKFRDKKTKKTNFKIANTLKLMFLKKKKHKGPEG